MSTINFQKDDSMVVKRKARQLIDSRNRYFHVVITSKLDECSHATVGDLYSMNMTMASCVKYFKTAFIQY